MAKDGTLRGGSRPGSGRKPMPLEQKILEGKAEPTNNVDENTSAIITVDVPKARAYIEATQKSGVEFKAKDVFINTHNWLVKNGCEKLVNYDVVERYANAYARYMQCEETISAIGMLAKHPTTGAPMQSPFVIMSEIYCKQAERAMASLDALVRRNCESGYQPFDADLKRFESYLS